MPVRASVAVCCASSRGDDARAIAGRYPQGLALVAPAPRWAGARARAPSRDSRVHRTSHSGYWAIFALNKEDIYVVRVPHSSL